MKRKISEAEVQPYNKQMRSRSWCLLGNSRIVFGHGQSGSDANKRRWKGSNRSERRVRATGSVMKRWERGSLGRLGAFESFEKHTAKFVQASTDKWIPGLPPGLSFPAPPQSVQRRLQLDQSLDSTREQRSSWVKKNPLSNPKAHECATGAPPHRAYQDATDTSSSNVLPSPFEARTSVSPLTLRRENSRDAFDVIREQQSPKSKLHSKEKMLCLQNRSAMLNIIREKPYSCPVCRERFNNMHGLDRHVSTAGHLKDTMDLTLDEIKSMQCPLCERSCCGRYSLMRHFLIHTGEKPFTCTICRKRFRQKGNMAVHIRVRHGLSESYKSNICGTNVALHSNLKQHLKKHGNRKKWPQCTRGLPLMKPSAWASLDERFQNESQLHY